MDRSHVTRAVLAGALADASEHWRQGRLERAEAAYRAILDEVPDEPEALHRLGMIAHRGGRHDAALALLERAVEVDAAQAIYRNDLGIVLHALGRVDDAIDAYRSAIAREPRYPRAYNGLGIALKDRGLADEAAESFRAALALAPDYVAARNNLANLLRDGGQPAEAAAMYRKALELRPESPQLWVNLGNALVDLQAFGEAAQAYQNAILLRPDREAFERLADALRALGQADAAAASYARALAFAETPEAIAGFVASLVAAELRFADALVRKTALRALTAPWARPSNLAAACLRIVASDANVRACIDRAWQAWPARPGMAALFDVDGEIVFRDALLRALLESTPVCDPATERFLTLARSAMLDAALDESFVATPDTLAFACAIARQCFINDYVFSCDAGEAARARRLRDAVEAALGRGEAVAPVRIALVASYVPLAKLAGGASLQEIRTGPLAPLVAQQVVEPADERRRRGNLRRLTDIDDATSRRVQAQYEEHPYPKWLRVPVAPAAPPVARDGGGALPPSGHAPGDGLDILIAGCGTGQESLEVALARPHDRVLAVDLSLASLAYADRNAQAQGVANVEHAQADILRLPALGLAFDVILSVGVLHHMNDPVLGLRCLASLLKPGGRMLVGLYSERGRADVVAARDFIAERGYAATADDIRRCRQDLMSCDDGRRFAMLASRSDFYVTSECRDLLFHVREHRFDLPRIGAILDALDLRFLGFVHDDAVASQYRERYPADASMVDLAQWDAFERERPLTFAGMYIFWVQKGTVEP